MRFLFLILFSRPFLRSSTRSLFGLRRIGFCVLALSLLQSCATLTDTPTDPAKPASAAQTQDPAPKPKQYSNFSIDTLYSLLVAELAATRKQYDLTLDNYVEEAKVTGDKGVIARAARLAQYFRNQSETLEMGQLWLAKEPNNIEANTVVATAYIELRKPLQALKYAETILSLIDSQASQERNANRRAAILETIANFSRGTDTLTRQTLIDRYQQLSLHYPQYTAILVGLSMLHQDKKDTATAYEIIQQALQKDSDYMPAILQEVRLLQASNQNDKAIAKLSKLLEDQPDNYRFRLLYARLLSQTDIEAAFEEFTLLSEQSPKNLDIKFSRALIALELKKRVLAERLLNELLAVQYRPNTIHFYLGNLAEADKRPKEALDHYLSITGGEDYISAHSRAARIMASQGQVEEAQLHFLKLREQSPNQKPRLYTAEAEVLELLGHVDLALNILNEAVTQYPDNINLRYNRSNLYEQSNQLELMESDLRHILTIEPDNASALNALGYFLTSRTERHEEALSLIEQALNLKPDDPAIMDSMGWVLFNLGRTNEAIAYLRKAFELFPDPEVAAHLGEALWVNGKKQEARSVWNKNLKDNPNDSRILDTMERLRVD